MRHHRAVTLFATFLVLVGCGPVVTTASAPVPAPAPTTVQVIKPPAAAPPASASSLPASSATGILDARDRHLRAGRLLPDRRTTTRRTRWRSASCSRCCATSQVSGGVYMGVGPEQNFSTSRRSGPKMAFIVDIRRQAVDAAPDVQGDVRAGERPRRLHLDSLRQAAPGGARHARRRSRQIWEAYRAGADGLRARGKELRARRRAT